MAKVAAASQQACLDQLYSRLEAETATGLIRRSSRRQLDAVCKNYSVGMPLREAPGRVLVVLSGWACEQRTSAEGRRQIFNFIAPGDYIAVQPAEEAGERIIVALTTLKLLDVRNMVDGDKTTSDRAWSGLTAYAYSAHRKRLYDHLTRLGQKSAYERVAHMLLDFHARLDAVGMVENRRFALPLTQEMLADALGITLVHVNRVLQQLRQQGLIEFSAGTVGLLRPKALAEIAEFDLESGPAARPYRPMDAIDQISA